MRPFMLNIGGLVAASACVCLSLSSCGTGIEVTDHVTDKDVQRVLDKGLDQLPVVTIETYQDSLPAWKNGKRFWVADDKVTQMLAYTDAYDKDTLQLAGHILAYAGYSLSGPVKENRRVYVEFDDLETGLRLVYHYGKEADIHHAGFSLPMLIDLDRVEQVSLQLVGKDFFIRTPIWYDRNSEQMIDGRHFIKVSIDSVLPGNAVMPLRVLFTTADTREQAMVWISDNSSTMHGRDFDSLFSAFDPRAAYPSITDANWERITRGQLAEGMTKEECRLALGSPIRIAERPDQAGMREYWYYDGGAYLYFVDGLLSQFRK